MIPSFLSRLADPSIRNVLVAGCGGGFDFLHGLTLLPELQRLGKRVTIGSYSFGDPARIRGAPTVLDLGGGVIVKRVGAAATGDPRYAPEVHLCAYLDAERPDAAPHEVYAYYARDFTVPALQAFYQELVRGHAIDAVILLDGGSDSLMAGDEEGLGDPIEDAVSVAAVAGLVGPTLRVLICLGVGADRYNHVSDAATLRAIAELTAAGGFLGALALEPTSPALDFYRRGIQFIYERQTFRSALTGFILAAARGEYGSERVPPELESRVRPGEIFLWPLMSMLWAFDVGAVDARSLLTDWIRDCVTVRDCHLALVEGRDRHGVRPMEELPRHVDFRAG